LIKRLLILFCFTPLFTFAQKREVGLALGACYYMGDLNPAVPFLGSRYVIGGFYRKHFDFRRAIKINLNYGKYTANDANSMYAYEKARNLNVSSYVAELSGQFEFNFLKFHGEDIKYYWSPYIFAGFGFFNFFPKGTINGKDVPLRKNYTEGQGSTSPVASKKTYANIQPCIPFGVGIKYQVTRFINFNIEWGMRKTFTDYLDDVSRYYADPYYLSGISQEAVLLGDKSLNPDPLYPNTGRQRGNFGTTDWYSYFVLSLAIKFKDPDATCPAY
jgi:hypothetical protein